MRFGADTRHQFRDVDFRDGGFNHFCQFRFQSTVGYEREKTKTQLRDLRAVGSKIYGALPQPYCFCVVALKEPGVVFPMSEFPWNDSIVPPFREIPVVFCAMMLSEMRIADVLLA